MAVKSKKVIGTIHCEMFSSVILLCYNVRQQEILKKLLSWDKDVRYWHDGIKNEVNHFEKPSWGFVLKRIVTRGKDEKTLFYLVIKNKFRFDDFDYCSLAHEVVHLCQFILPDILDRDREIEAEAYFHSYLMTKVLDAIRAAK